MGSLQTTYLDICLGFLPCIILRNVTEYHIELTRRLDKNHHTICPRNATEVAFDAEKISQNTEIIYQ